MTEEALTYHVSQFRKGRFQDAQVTAIQEVPLTIYLNGQEIVTLLCMGKHAKTLAVGFLKSDGFIADKGQLKETRVEEGRNGFKVRVETRHDPFKLRPLTRSMTSGCGKGTDFERNLATIAAIHVSARLTVSPQQVLELMAGLHKRSTLYQATRGCHNACLATPEEILIFREDIGRHNAMDMIGGTCFLEDIPTGDKLVVTTGRIASEILLKALRLGVPILASGAAATRFSIDLARKTNLTLIGQVEQGRLIVYHSGGRIAGL